MLNKRTTGNVLKAFLVLFLVLGVATAASVSIAEPTTNQIINEGETINIETTAERTAYWRKGRIVEMTIEIRDLNGNRMTLVDTETNQETDQIKWTGSRTKKTLSEVVQMDANGGTYELVVKARESRSLTSDVTTTRKVQFQYNPRPTATINFEEPGTINKQVEITADGYDAQGYDLTYKWEIDGNTYTGETINPIFTEPALHRVKLMVEDEHGAVGIVEEDIRIISPQEPIAAISADKTSSMQPPLTVQFDASGSGSYNGEITYYKWDFNNDGTWDQAGSNADKVTHTYWQEGNFEAVVQVTDETGKTATNKIPIQIHYNANNPPEVTVSANTEEPRKGETIVLYGHASDPDGDSIAEYRWDFNSDGNWDYVSTTSGVVTHTYDEADLYAARFQAVDGRGAESAAKSVIVKVGQNRLPKITNIVGPEVTLRQGKGFHFYVEAEDEDGYVKSNPEAFKWDFNNDGNWEYVSPWTGYAVHTYDEEGKYVAVVKVTDNDGDSTTHPVVVNVEKVNTEPELANGNVQPTNPEDTDMVSFSAEYRDADNDKGEVRVYYKEQSEDWEEGNVKVYNLQTTCTDYTTWCTYTAQTEVLEEGTYEYYFTADDGYDAVQYPVQGVRTFTVGASNEPPEVDLLHPRSGEKGIRADRVDLEVDIYDADGDQVTVRFYENGTNFLIGTDQVNGQGEAEVRWSDLEYETTYKWYVEASDGTTTVTSKVWNFTTEKEPEAVIRPIADAGHDRTVETNQEVTFTGKGYTEEGQIARYRWDFNNDGTWNYVSTTTGTTTHTYTEPGTYTAKLEVRNTQGYTDTDTVKVTVKLPEEEIPTESFTENVEYPTTANIRVTGRYRYDADEGTTEMVMKFENRADKENGFRITMDIPSTIAQTINDIAIFPAPDEVILENPTVAWNVSLAPLETFQVVLRKDGYVPVSQFKNIVTHAQEIEIVDEPVDEPVERPTGITGMVLGALANPAIGLMVLIALIVISLVVWKRDDIKARLKENLRK